MFKISYIYDLVDNITPQLKKIQSSLEATKNKVHSIAGQMSTSFSNLTDTIKRTSQSFNNAGMTLAPLSVAMGLVATKAFKSAAEFEMLRIRMNVLTGSVEKGGLAFEEVTKYAAKTPFQIADISKSLNMLMSTGGMQFEDAMKTIKVLGDIASISGGEMSGMALAFSQTSATTRLLGGDFNQFVNNSVPLMKILTDYTGKTTAQIMAMKEKGELSFDIVAKAMAKATQKGGLFENGAEKMSQTLTGLASTLIDSVNIAFGELGTEMAKAINLSSNITKITDVIATLTDKFKALSPETQKFITYAILITAVLSPAMLILGSLAGVLGLATAGFVLFGKAIAMVFAMSPWILGLQLAIGVMYLFREELMIIYDFLQNKLVSAFDYVAEKLKMVMGLINQFRADTSIVLDFIGLDKLSKIVAPKIVAPQINPPQIVVPKINPLEIVAPKINPLEILAPQINEPAQINKPQQLTAGGQLDVNIKGLPQGSSAGFTPRPNNFLPVGVNSVFAGF